MPKYEKTLLKKYHLRMTIHIQTWFYMEEMNHPIIILFVK